MKKQCANCRHWIPLIDNGQCNKDVKHYSEYDDCCDKHKRQGLVVRVFRNTYRIGIGNFFIQFDFDYWWQFILRINYTGFAISRARGFHIRNYKI